MDERSEIALEQARVRTARAHTARAHWILLVLGVSLAMGYGLLTGVVFSNQPASAEGSGFWVMLGAFLLVVPFAIGLVAVFFARLVNPLTALFFAAVPAGGALAVAVLFRIDGLICVMMWMPAYVCCAGLGGLTALLVRKLRRKAVRAASVSAVVCAPYVLAPIEKTWTPPEDLRRVETQIVIDADVATVWRNIVEVPAIQADEHTFAFSHWIGFPRPIAATLTGNGVGAVRHASFERGVVFIETVTEWREGERLEFTIDVDPNTIPPEALDEHVTIGGPYFDVLEGAYVIEALPQGGVTLHLSSEHRVSTTFNAYARLWTDFVMRDTQDYILEIVRNRCEREARH